MPEPTEEEKVEEEKRSNLLKTSPGDSNNKSVASDSEETKSQNSNTSTRSKTFSPIGAAGKTKKDDNSEIYPESEEEKRKKNQASSVNTGRTNTKKTEEAVEESKTTRRIKGGVKAFGAMVLYAAAPALTMAAPYVMMAGAATMALGGVMWASGVALKGAAKLGGNYFSPKFKDNLERSGNAMQRWGMKTAVAGVGLTAVGVGMAASPIAAFALAGEGVYEAYKGERTPIGITNAIGTFGKTMSKGLDFANARYPSLDSPERKANVEVQQENYLKQQLQKQLNKNQPDLDDLSETMSQTSSTSRSSASSRSSFNSRGSSKNSISSDLTEKNLTRHNSLSSNSSVQSGVLPRSGSTSSVNISKNIQPLPQQTITSPKNGNFTESNSAMQNYLNTVTSSNQQKETATTTGPAKSVAETTATKDTEIPSMHKQNVNNTIKPRSKDDLSLSFKKNNPTLNTPKDDMYTLKRFNPEFKNYTTPDTGSAVPAYPAPPAPPLTPAPESSISTQNPINMAKATRAAVSYSIPKVTPESFNKTSLVRPRNSGPSNAMKKSIKTRSSRRSIRGMN